MTADQVQELFDGLEANGLTEDYTHILTGKQIMIIYVYAQKGLRKKNRLYWELLNFRKG